MAYLAAQDVQEEPVDRLHRRPSSEEGLGLIELMVSMLIIGLVLTALASALITSLREIDRNEALIHATALQQEILEQTVSLPWELIGLYSDKPGFQTTVTEDTDTFTTVDLGPAGGPGDDRVPPPLRTDTRGGTEYTVRTDIYRIDADGDAVFESKRVRTTVTWSALGLSQESVSHATRAETGQEIDDSFEVLHFAPSPNEIQLDVAGKTVGPINFNVKFTKPAFPGSLSVPTPAGALTLTLVSENVEGTLWSGELPAGTEVLSGDQLVELSATSDSVPSESATAAVTVTFVPDGAAPPSSGFAINSVNVLSPGGIRVVKNSNKACSYQVEVRVDGFTGSTDVVNVEYEYWGSSTGSNSAPDTSDTVSATHMSNSGSVGIFVASIPATADHHLRKGKTFAITGRATPADASTTEEEIIQVSATEVDAC